MLLCQNAQICDFSSSHVQMWKLDNIKDWVLKNWSFKLQCWRRLLKVLWTARRSNQSILKEINPEYSLEGMSLKLKLQYFGHLMKRADSLEKTLTLGKIEGDERRQDDWMASPIQWIWVRANWKIMKDGEAWHATVHGVTKNWSQLSDWTTTTSYN